MRIKVKSADANFSLRLPSILCFNAIGAAIASKSIKTGLKHSNTGLTTHIPYSLMRKLFKEVRKSRKLLQGQPLISVDSADGAKVEIWI